MGFGPLDILVFLAVLGILVFVHELGHFVAAKLCGIYVDRFSLGMPPRLFGFRYGETDYCIGLLPIGGYVKMAGQEDQPLSDEEREKTYGHVPSDRWFNKKPVWQRAFVLVAGPAMNLVLALCIYGFMAGYGREVPQAEIETRVGDVEKDSPASKAPMFLAEAGQQTDFKSTPDATGWHTGDRIVTINGEPVKLFEDIMVAAILSGGEQAVVEIERSQADGSTARYVSPITAQVFGEFKDARRFGISPYTPALVRQVFPESPAQLGGIKPGDLIIEANGTPTDQQTFATMVRDLPPDTALPLTVDRNGEQVKLTVQTRREGAFKDIAFSPPLSVSMLLPDGEPLEVLEENPEVLKTMGLQTGDRIVTANGSTDLGTTLRHVQKNSPTENVALTVERPKFFGKGNTWTVNLSAADTVRAITGIDPQSQPTIAAITPELSEKTGLQRKDRIVEIDGAPATVARLQELEDTRIGDTLPIVVERPAILLGLGQKSETVKAEIAVAGIQQIGVGFGMKTVIRREEPANIVPYAFKEAWRQSARIYSVLHQLLTGGLSPKLLGGPVMIGDIVTTASKIGFMYLIDITAMISVNLAIFNLLPLPVLDGGQLVFLLIEAVRRRPVSTRVMEATQQVGFVLIIGLLLFVTFNDVSRIVQRILP